MIPLSLANTPSDLQCPGEDRRAIGFQAARPRLETVICLDVRAGSHAVTATALTTHKAGSASLMRQRRCRSEEAESRGGAVGPNCATPPF